MSEDIYEGEPEPITQELEELADDVIDYALDAMCNQGSFNPMLAVEDAHGQRVMLTFDDEELEECLDAARGMVATAASGKKPIKGLNGGPVRYAIGFDGAIRESDGDPYKSAVIVEYGETGLSTGYSAYLLYKNPGKPQEFVWTDPAAAGETELLV